MDEDEDEMVSDEEMEDNGSVIEDNIPERAALPLPPHTDHQWCVLSSVTNTTRSNKDEATEVYTFVTNLLRNVPHFPIPVSPVFTHVVAPLPKMKCLRYTAPVNVVYTHSVQLEKSC